MLDRLAKHDVQIFRTDLQGTVIARSDGKDIYFNTVAYESPTTKTTTSDTKSESKYVLNTTSKKIHYSYCKSVKSKSEKNKKFTDDFEGAIADGFVGCKNCKPN